MNGAEAENVRRRFEREAESFDAIYRLERSWFWRWFNVTFRKGIFERYDLTFQHAGDVTGKTVLDVGCGSGIYCADFARRGAARVLGVDLSSSMLALAGEEAKRQGVAQQCEFRQGNFMNLDFEGQFDISIAMGVFDYLADPLVFLQKMVSITRERVIASFPGHSPVREPLRRLRYKLAGKGNVYFYSEADLRRLVTGSGLDTSRSELIPIRSSGTGFVLVGER